MAVAPVDIAFKRSGVNPIAPLLQEALDAQKKLTESYKKTSDFVQKEQERVNKHVKNSYASQIQAKRNAESAIQKAAQDSANKQAQLSSKTTKQLIADYVALQNKKKNAMLAFEREEDTSVKRALAKKKQAIDQELREYKTASLKRGGVLTGGEGAQAGILGTGRNLIGGGLAKAGVGIGIATVAFKALYSHAKEADDAIDGIDIALAKVGDTSEKTRSEMLKYGAQLADDFAMRETEVNKLQAIVAGYGGQVGETNKQIVELAIGNAAALNTSADSLAKVFAKASDPENEAQLTKYGLVFRKGATDTERWNAILQKFGGAVKAAKDTTRDGMGEATRVMNKVSDSIAKLADKIITALTPAFKVIGTVIDDVILPAFEFLMPVIEGIATATFGLAGVIVSNWGRIKQFVADAWQWIKDRWDDIKSTLSDISFGLIGESREEIEADKARTARMEKTANSISAMNEKNDKEQAERAARRIAEQTKLEESLDPTKFAEKTDEQLKKEEAARKEAASKSEQARKKAYDSALKDLERDKQLLEARGEFSIEKEGEYLKKREEIAAEHRQQEELKEAAHQIKLYEIRNSIGIPSGAVGRVDAMPAISGGSRRRGGAIGGPSLQSFVDNLTGLNGADLREEDAEEKLNRTTAALDPLIQGMNALTESFVTGGNSFQSFVRTFLSGLQSMVAALLAKAAIFGLLSLIPGLMPATMTVGKFLGFAKGGDAPIGIPSVVGEEGPEFIFPHKGGTKVMPMSPAMKRSIRMGAFIGRGGGKPSQSIRTGAFIGVADGQQEAISKRGGPSYTDFYNNEIWKTARPGDYGLGQLAAQQAYSGGSSGGGMMNDQQFAELLSAVKSPKLVEKANPWNDRTWQQQQAQSDSVGVW